jgi:hypothetical protein
MVTAGIEIAAEFQYDEQLRRLEVIILYFLKYFRIKIQT